MNKQIRVSIVAISFSWLISMIGCGDLIPPRPPINSPSNGAAAESSESDENEVVDEAVPVEPFTGDWSAWYVHRFGSQVVGITEMSATSTIDFNQIQSGPSEVSYLRRERMIFRSGRVSFVRRVTLTTDETAEGSIKRFRSDVVTGPSFTRIQGSMSGQKLSVKTSIGAEERKHEISLPDRTRGLFTLEQTLRRRLIEKGETRRLPVLLPTFQTIGVLELRCTGKASVGMLDGSYKLLMEVDVDWFENGNQIDSSVVWVNEEGTIEKSLRPAIRLESFRTDRSTAQQQYGESDDSLVKVSVAGTLRDDADPNQVAYLVVSRSANQTDDEDGNELLVNPIGQQSVRKVDDGLQVLVAAEPNSESDFQHDRSKPGENDTKQTTLLDFGQAVVARMSNSIGDLPAKDLAVELSHLASNDLSLAPQEGLRSASAIIRAGEGGEIDHAIVLASLLRARQIPARLVFGLSRIKDSESSTDKRVTMKFTAWVSASIDGQWISIDPMTSQVNRADQLALSRPSADVDLSAELQNEFRRLTGIEVEIRGANY